MYKTTKNGFWHFTIDFHQWALPVLVWYKWGSFGIAFFCFSINYFAYTN